MAKQKYEWGWESFFQNGERFEEAEGYASKAAVLQDVQKARAEEKKSLADGFQDESTLVKYVIRRRVPPVEPPPWESVPG